MRTAQHRRSIFLGSISIELPSRDTSSELGGKMVLEDIDASGLMRKTPSSDFPHVKVCTSCFMLRAFLEEETTSLKTRL